MKRLFRNSKPVIDPLPPPTPTADYTQSQQQQQQQQQTQNGPAVLSKKLAPMKLEGMGHPPAEVSGGGGGKSWFGGIGAPSVTPFPVDAGSGGHSSGGGASGIMRRVSRRDKKDKSDKGSAPSMLEMQQQQQQQQISQRQPAYPTQSQHEQSYPIPAPKQPLSRFYEEPTQPDISSPDSAYTLIPPNPPQRRYAPPLSNSQEHLHSRSQTPPLAIPIAPAMYGGGGGSGRSSPSAQHYLPPSARPPTPPAALRPATPNYGRSPMGHSQSSLLSNPPHVDDGGNGGVRVGRDRGYSSASGSMRGSDVESSTGHGLSKSVQAHQVRSPLAHAYAAPPPPTSFPNPQPHPFQLPLGDTPNPYSPQEDETRRLSMPPPPPPQQQQAAMPPPQQQAMYDDHQPQSGKEKDKKKFWGMDMGWAGGKKDKDEKKNKEKDHLGVPDQRGDGGRRSFDWSRAQDHTVNQTGYAVTTSQPNGVVGNGGMNMGSPMVMEDEQRGRMAGKMFFRDQDPSSAKDVTIAIQMLCANPDPSFSAIYGVCDRMNNAESSDTVSKEAARAIRKQFKHGNEGERRAVAVVWLLMMRNVPSIRIHAASKKFMASLEPIILASSQKPLVNPNTHRTIVDILADLAYHFGNEKGCEPLVDMWKKVKMPQEPDNGRPLPDDHQIFTPEAQYPTHMLDRQNHVQPHHGQNGGGGYAPPIPHDTRPRGGGYGNMPNHSEDMMRLIEESTAAQESARVLTEALVYSRPEDLEHKPIIREFYNKCFHAHESLTNQMDWAQAEARSSRERTMMNGLSLEPTPEGPKTGGDTIEESALSALFEAHAALSEAIKQHDELDRMAMEQREMSEVRERSKKDVKMGRDDPMRYEQRPAPGFLSAGTRGQASGSRSPSPNPIDRMGASPRTHNLPLPPFSAHTDRSRTPSPDSLPLPPKISSSPTRRPASPLGARAPRPLPNPFKTTGSNNSLNTSSAGHSAWVPPVGADLGKQAAGRSDEVDGDEASVPSVPLKPSRKALGKRPAAPVDPDNHFDPNDMFAGKKEDSSKASSDEESVTVDDVFFHKPIVYAYDAYQEKIELEAKLEQAGGKRPGAGSGSGGSANRLPALPRFGGGSGGSGYDQQGSARVDARA